MPLAGSLKTGGAYRLDVDQQMQRALRSTIGNVDLQGILAAAERAEVRHDPVQIDQP